MWATAISIAAVGLIKLVFNIVIGRSYGEDVLGEVSIALAIIMISSTVCGAGIGAGTTRLVSRKLESDPLAVKGTYGGALITIALASIVAASFLMIFSDEISDYLGIEVVLVYFVSIVSILRALYLLLRGMMYGLDIIERYYKIELFADVLFLSALFITVSISDYENVFLPFVIMYLAFILISSLSVHRTIGKPLFSRAMLSKTASSSGIFTLGTASSTGMTNMGFVLGAIWIAKADIGLFSAAFQIAAIFLIITQITNNVLFPAFARMGARGDIDGLKRAYGKALYFLALIAIVISGTIALSAPHVLNILFGPGFEDAGLMLEIMLLGTALYIVASPAVSFLTSSRITDVWISAKASFLAAAAAIIFWVSALDYTGPIGLPIGILIGQAVQSAIPLVVSATRLKEGFGKTRRTILIGIGLFTATRVLAEYLEFEVAWIAAVIFLLATLSVFRKDILELITIGLKSLKELAGSAVSGRDD